MSPQRSTLGICISGNDEVVGILGFQECLRSDMRDQDEEMQEQGTQQIFWRLQDVEKSALLSTSESSREYRSDYGVVLNHPRPVGYGRLFT